MRAVFGVDFGGEGCALDAKMAEDGVVPVCMPLVAGLFPGEFNLAQFASRVEFRTGENAFSVFCQVEWFEGIERFARRTGEIVDQFVEQQRIANGVLQLRYGRNGKRGWGWFCCFTT